MSLKFTALTIREGDAFLLEDNGWKCLFDSGKDGIIVDLLKYKGIDKLDLAICSHNDADHANGFIELLQSGIKIDEIWLPGLWASILQYIKDNRISRVEIDCCDEYYNGELESLYSGESLPCESFNKELSFLEEGFNSKESCHFHDLIPEMAFNLENERPISWARCIAQYLAHYIANFIIQDQDINNKLDQDCLVDGIKELLKDYCCPINTNHMANFIDRHYNKKNFTKDSIERNLVDDLELFLIVDCLKYHFRYGEVSLYLEIKSKWAKSFDLKLSKILEIAKWAYQRHCKIRWFEPTSVCVKSAIAHGFVALNSKEMFSVKKLKNTLAYLYALTLSKENKNSLVFEYVKNTIPIIRFSADSNSICQSIPIYHENIIVTAPHHGSKANANVYKAIQGDDIIWVRSDSLKKTQGRPCADFKSKMNKYCLACKSNNFISEVCFEYDHGQKLWRNVHGELCRC